MVDRSGRDTPGLLDEQIGRSRSVLERLRDRWEAEGEVAIDELLAELSQTLEELEVTAEELEQQNRELRQLTDEVVREQRRYRELFDLAPDPYVVTDHNGMILEANRQACTLLNVDRPARVPLAGYVATADVAEFRRRVRHLAEGEPARDWDLTLAPRGRPQLIVNVDVARGSHPDGKRVLRWVLRDVTATRRSQEALQQAFARAEENVEYLRDVEGWKNAMLAAAAHELRSPLSLIQVAAGTALDDPGSAHRDRLLGQIQAHATRAQTVLSNVLDLDRLTRGVVRADRERVRLDRVVVDALETVGSGDHPLTTDLEAMTVTVDPGQIRQITTNLIDNAIRHTPAGTPVHVSLHAEERTAVLTVRDEGPGLPAELADDLFAPFTTAACHDDDPGGAGIGLSLVRLFAELHGGTATAEDPGGGARFAVELPDCVEPDAIQST